LFTRYDSINFIGQYSLFTQEELDGKDTYPNQL
jgi:hypothetical protein